MNWPRFVVALGKIAAGMFVKNPNSQAKIAVAGQVADATLDEIEADQKAKETKNVAHDEPVAQGPAGSGN